MSTSSPVREVVGGVDTHKDTHYAAVITTTGQHLAVAQFPTTSAGYEALIAFITSFGVVLRIDALRVRLERYHGDRASQLDRVGRETGNQSRCRT